MACFSLARHHLGSQQLSVPTEGTSAHSRNEVPVAPYYMLLGRTKVGNSHSMNGTELYLQVIDDSWLPWARPLLFIQVPKIHKTLVYTEQVPATHRFASKQDPFLLPILHQNFSRAKISQLHFAAPPLCTWLSLSPPSLSISPHFLSFSLSKLPPLSCLSITDVKPVWQEVHTPLVCALCMICREYFLSCTTSSKYSTYTRSRLKN